MVVAARDEVGDGGVKAGGEEAPEAGAGGGLPLAFRLAALAFGATSDDLVADDT